MMLNVDVRKRRLIKCGHLRTGGRKRGLFADVLYGRPLSVIDANAEEFATTTENYASVCSVGNNNHFTITLYTCIIHLRATTLTIVSLFNLIWIGLLTL